MTKGLGKFEFYFIQLDSILKEAAKTANPALYFYEHDGRTKVFMLEGLAKLYSGMHNEKKFQKIKDAYKSLEDLLGAVDYYDSFAKDFKNDAKIPDSITLFMEEKKTAKLAELNALLLKKKWINRKPTRTDKQRKKLKELNWKKEEKEIVLIKQVYEKAIATIQIFYEETGVAFTDVEAQVHELRRKLRWLSIYPQAIQGAIQLIDSGGKNTKDVKKYLVPEIVNSPYNKLPVQGSHEFVLYLEKNYFLALSYVISSLGKLKDKGLRIMAISEAVMETQAISADAALQKAYKINKENNTALEDILHEAKLICQKYFEENNLEKMMGN